MEPNKDQLAQLGSNKSVPVPVNTIKVVFVGPAQSGKSCIVNGYQ